MTDLKKDLKAKAESTGNPGKNSIAKSEQQLFGDQLKLMMPEIARVLPRHITPDRMARIALTTVRLNPKILQCNRSSVLGAVMSAATLGLEPNVMGQCYIIPFNNRQKGILEAQFIIGYQGYIELFYRSGRVLTVYADAVFSADKFSYKYGITETLEHEPSNEVNRGEITHFYAYCKMEGGAYRFVVLPKASVDHIRDTYSQAARSKSSPWHNNYKEMGCKTAIRALAKWVPKSAEVIEAMKHDDTVRDSFKDDPGFVSDIIDVPEEKKEETVKSEEKPVSDGKAG